MGMHWLVTIFVVLNIAYVSWGIIFTPVESNSSNDLYSGTQFAKSTYRSHNGKNCYTLGPYKTENSAQWVLKKIQIHGIKGSIRRLKSFSTREYGVYIPPLGSRKEAENIVRALQHFDVPANYIVPSGKYKNAIIFKYLTLMDRDQAERQRQYIIYLGQPAEILERDTDQTVYWLDYEEPTDKPLKRVLEWSIEKEGGATAQKIDRHCIARKKENRETNRQSLLLSPKQSKSDLPYDQ